jgi:glycosyltransferase involved in cell wall biosynthesis
MNKKLKIDIIARDGSPLGVDCLDIYGDNGRVGVGGAELAILTLMEAWHNAGHSVRFYNNPIHIKGSPFPHYPVNTFIPNESRDILIIFRSPNPLAKNAKGKKVWFSCDQYTIGSFKDFATEVDSIVTISPFHAQHFKSQYGIENTTTIDLPVRLQDYEQKIEKVKNRLIFCSVPDRGLAILADSYPLLKREVSDLSLVVTSDYRLWGVGHAGNEQYIRKFLGQDGVNFLGAIGRRDLVQEQMRAQIQSYSCLYEELFCYAVAECQVAGALPVTSDIGALATTNMGVRITGNPHSQEWRGAFVASIVHILNSPDLEERQKELQQKAIERFSLKRIMKIWDEEVFCG